ncbi:hypothetical protein [Sphingobium sp. WCS2017Hpa-17]|uniref:hypothetical protein n=1 Tax=Sphingobium sp. WCS2017Hpa-17 TaxID=3073638 RepID=UPI00288AB7EF|nr:hypothetical protein [Sphingobium sp. WCS2017Hpa-17]
MTKKMIDMHGIAAPKGQTFLDPEVVEMMKRLATGQTDEALNDRFGISYNTWRKLVAGRAVRHSLAQRLTERVAVIAASC